MNQMEVNVHSFEDTFQLAEKLSKFLKAGDVIALEGDLGAGKTSFTKGLAKGLGIQRNVNSPTFTIIKEYHGRLPLYHMDVYRMKDSMEDLGFDEYFHGDGICVVEWAHIIEDQLPNNLLIIEIQYVDETSRKIQLRPIGERYKQVCEEFFHEYFSD
ncbi:tRNA (adenosine(37)-N6)-threonylcarbamoyltransferase complex ATPase subunit type 1 TsaE [Caldibacillus lycopersici]|uniref:tRNA threonylcarbamoyladenosine biosynthesis protein TsaE n=1 Tax=Perspicuibacillus lycopersici TaxID=1325689 RepID=A0AAE3IYL6_9BACI|nr:tRNA (adenosine(37)-N6)-threonylcarbamoyltransferase complex ATPase subunit type 1 TsaE [Perspicuibacillus lycopersici]MCU9615314.1 tRNA (adenosine(37)-N6)-threonylcarbamoyltransferase complex ATPase subunit type 1 TsaE [Perspicuibacillus lycopersici]